MTKNDSLCTVCLARLTTGDEEADLHAAVKKWLLHFSIDLENRPINIQNVHEVLDAATPELLALIAHTARVSKPDNPTF